MNLTDMVVVGTIGMLFAYEIYTLSNKKIGDTISESVWRVSLNRPLIPFLSGMLCGHFFWQAAL